ncbi:MAG: DNA-directed RNA polymerase subunit D [Candidatus Woesearchaeota archaeon]
MDIKLLSKDKNKVSLRIKGTDEVFLNTLRRLIIEEVPTLAIEDVNFIDNSSALYDEMMALRLGLIPLKTDLKSYVLPEEAKNESDPRAFLNFKLKVKGPITVYASDLESQDPEVAPVYEKMIIVKLLKDQKLELEATARLGKGKQHMKFSPGLAYYFHVPIVNVEKGDAGEFKDKYPSQIFDKTGKIDAKLINTQGLVDACKNVNNDIIEIKEKKDEFDFVIEPWGQLSVKEMLTEAFKALDNKLDEFEKLVKKIK